MKKIFFLLFCLTFLQLHAQQVKDIHVSTAGTLESLLGADKTTTTGLTLTGIINNADFTTIKQMTALKNLDMGAVDIVNGTIPVGAFEKKVMEKLVLPNSLKVIGSGAFEYATISALDFTVCPLLEEIGWAAFANIKLTTNVLDFSNCSQLSRFPIYGSMHCAFTSNNSHVILPQSMTVLPMRIFQYFNGSVELSKNLETLGTKAFEAAILNELKLPASVKNIGSEAFKSATLSNGLELPASLEIIGQGAFTYATISSLDFTVCPLLEEIGSGAFGTIKLTTNVLDFSNCSQLTRFPTYGNMHCAFTSNNSHVILPQSLTVLPTRIFQYFNGSVELSRNLEAIGTQAFANSKLTQGLFLPKSLKTIQQDAFKYATMPSLKFEGADGNISCP